MSGQTEKPVLLYCGHKAANDANLVRQICLTIHLVDHFRVVLMIPPHHVARFPLLDNVEFLDTPEISVNRGGVATSPAAEHSAQAMVGLYGSIDPSVVIIEDYPFQTSTDERLGVILTCTANAQRPPLMICSLLDPMYPRSSNQEEQVLTARILNSRFHAVLVHADPSFSRLEDHFRVASLVKPPIQHCGFIAMAAPGKYIERQHQALVLMGDCVNERIVRAAVDARQLLRSPDGTEMKVVVQLSDVHATAWPWLSSYAVDVPGVSVNRVPAHETGIELVRSTFAVSGCTYHHMCEVLASGVRALFLLDATSANTVELERALRLQRLGAAELTDISYLNGPTLALHLHRLNRVPFSASTLDFGGAAYSAGLLRELAARRRKGEGLSSSGY